MRIRTRTFGKDSARLVVFGFVLALHVLLALMLGRALHFAMRPSAVEPVSVWIRVLEPTSAPARIAIPRGARANIPPVAVTVPDIHLSAGTESNVAVAPETAPTAIDFAAEATRAAVAVAAQARRDSMPRNSMGTIPGIPSLKSAAPPAYAWSHQPLGRHADFHSGVLVLGTRRCGVAFLLIIPAGFGCVLGRLDPEPGRNDLFDPKYKQPELELPKPALPEADVPP